MVAASARTAGSDRLDPARKWLGREVDPWRYGNACQTVDQQAGAEIDGPVKACCIELLYQPAHSVRRLLMAAASVPSSR
jgi:hypothetical protein